MALFNFKVTKHIFKYMFNYKKILAELRMVLTKKEVIQLASFFYKNKKLAHIKLKPTGYIDGYIISELINNAIYKIKNIDGKIEEIFLLKIYDIKFYEERI